MAQLHCHNNLVQDYLPYSCTRDDAQGVPVQTCRTCCLAGRQTPLCSAQETGKDGKNGKKLKRIGASEKQAADGQQQDALQSLSQAHDKKGRAPQYALQPDTLRIASVDDESAVVGPDSDDVQYVWERGAELPNLLPNILLSATLDKGLFLEVRKQRQRASQSLPHCSQSHGLCPHVGATYVVESVLKLHACWQYFQWRCPPCCSLSLIHISEPTRPY